MSAMESQITIHQPHDCLLNRFNQAQIKENIKAPRHWPLWGGFTVTGEFPAQRASNAENVSIWWRHHDCPFVTSVGSLNVTVKNHTWPQLESKLSYVEEGGRWKPTHCRPRHRIAIIIPYRDRDNHLRVLLNHLHPFLQRQLLEYRIYVAEQVSHYTIGYTALVANTGTTILGSIFYVKSLQLIWRSGIRRFYLRVPDLQMGCRDLIPW